VRQAAGWLAEAGYAVEEVEPPAIEQLAALWRRLVLTDARVLLASAIDAHGDDGLRRAFGFMAATAGEVDLASFIGGLAERVAHLRAWSVFATEHPLVLGPVSTDLPFPIGFDTRDQASTDEAMRAQRLLVAVNVLSLPAVAVPTGLAGDLPVGVQVIGPWLREDLCLDAAEVIEARAPMLTPIGPRPAQAERDDLC
jgi:amidase